MNKAHLIGRLTRDPAIRYSSGAEQVMIARFTLAVDRRGGQQEADFIPCVMFDKQAEFAEKYLHRGTKVAATGRIQTGSYVNKEGRKVYTTEVVVSEIEFVESKAAGERNQNQNAESQGMDDGDGFMNIPDGVDEEIPFL